MKRVDMNIRYRSCAIFCAVNGRKNNGTAKVSWDSLEKRFGIGWESLVNELKVKGMLFGGSGYVYLRPDWQAMTAAEQMEEIMKMYPHKYVER